LSKPVQGLNMIRPGTPDSAKNEFTE